MQIQDHPVIRNLELTGYPDGQEPNYPICPICYEETDTFYVDPVKVCRGRPVGLLWASPDCKHFSRAKGAALATAMTRANLPEWCGKVYVTMADIFNEVAI